MKAIKSLNKFLLLIPVLLGLGSCKHDVVDLTTPNENVRPAADFAKNNYDLSLFSAAIEKAGMYDQLNGKGPFTLMAPNNKAFNEIGILTPSDFDKMDKEELKAMVQRHVLPELITTKEVPANGIDVRYVTLEGTSVYTTYVGYPIDRPTSFINRLYFNGSYATRKDIQLTNGVLHLLDKVMKVNAKNNPQSWLSSQPKYSLFVAALKKFSLWDQLSQKVPFTVFAPTNSAFEAAGVTAEAIAAMNPQDYNVDHLFGGNVLKNKHFFISDLSFFKATSRVDPYLYQLENDPWLVSMVLQEGNAGDRSLFIRLQSARTQPYQRIEPGMSLKDPALSDYVVGDAVFHEVQALMIPPAKALKGQ